MMAGKQNKNSIISIGLMITFLFTALALPIVGSHDRDKIRTCAIKSSDNLANQGTQLPLAERENEEEESFNERVQNFSIFFIAGPVENLVSFNAPVQSTYAQPEYSISSELPLYLSKRTLLI